jgi:hypothetical protein
LAGWQGIINQDCVLEEGTAIGMTEPTRANSGISNRVVARCRMDRQTIFAEL